MSRDDLERTALESVCACWHYDLADTVANLSDKTLEAVIDDPQYFHHENQQHNPVSEREYRNELAICPSWVSR